MVCILTNFPSHTYFYNLVQNCKNECVSFLEIQPQFVFVFSVYIDDVFSN